MWFKKSFPVVRSIYQSTVGLATPLNLNYWYNFGSLLGLCLVIQLITGIFLAMHYNPSVNEAFNSVQHIMSNVNNGWLLSYSHANGASAFFVCVYVHVASGIYYGSYLNRPVWFVGVIILFLMMATAFIGYVLPWGQMSFWGATVITNFITAIPYIGQTIVEWIWGGYSVGNPTLNSFLSLHYLLPFVLCALVFIHLIFLHENGSSTPLGISGKYSLVNFHPYYTINDLLGFFVFAWFFSVVIFFYPNAFGDPENFIKANSLVTPIHIMPEWYFLFAYTILSTIPNNLGGVLMLVLSILILMIMPFIHNSYLSSLTFSPLMQVWFWILIATFILLTLLGSNPVEQPYIPFCILASTLYFIWFGLHSSISSLETFLFTIGNNNNASTGPVGLMTQGPFSVSASPGGGEPWWSWLLSKAGELVIVKVNSINAYLISCLPALSFVFVWFCFSMTLSLGLGVTVEMQEWIVFGVWVSIIYFIYLGEVTLLVLFVICGWIKQNWLDILFFLIYPLFALHLYLIFAWPVKPMVIGFITLSFLLDSFSLWSYLIWYMYKLFLWLVSRWMVILAGFIYIIVSLHIYLILGVPVDMQNDILTLIAIIFYIVWLWPWTLNEMLTKVVSWFSLHFYVLADPYMLILLVNSFICVFWAVHVNWFLCPEDPWYELNSEASFFFLYLHTAIEVYLALFLSIITYLESKENREAENKEAINETNANTSETSNALVPVSQNNGLLYKLQQAYIKLSTWYSNHPSSMTKVNQSYISVINWIKKNLGR